MLNAPARHGLCMGIVYLMEPLHCVQEQIVSATSEPTIMDTDGFISSAGNAYTRVCQQRTATATTEHG